MTLITCLNHLLNGGKATKRSFPQGAYIQLEADKYGTNHCYYYEQGKKKCRRRISLKDDG